VYPGVELRLLRYVVAVAEELHFSRAANKLNVAQPSLSKQIIELENDLEIELFERTKREVRLTDAGRAFVQEAKVALLHSQRAVHVAKASRQGARFNLGYSPHINFEILFRARSTLVADFPNVKCSVVSAFSYQQLQMIRAGELHAGLVALPLSADGVTIETIHREPLVVAMSRKSQLHSRRTIHLSTLHQEPMVAIAKSIHPGFYEYLYQVFSNQGFEPTIVQEVITMSECLRMVAEGVGYTLVPLSSYEQFRTNGVVFKAIEKTPLWLEFGVAYKSEIQSAMVQRLLGCLERKKKPQRAGVREVVRSA
jgi:DNA-binding transcriptional LysR family regulator